MCSLKANPTIESLFEKDTATHQYTTILCMLARPWELQIAPETALLVLMVNAVAYTLTILDKSYDAVNVESIAPGSFREVGVLVSLMLSAYIFFLLSLFWEARSEIGEIKGILASFNNNMCTLVTPPQTEAQLAKAVHITTAHRCHLFFTVLRLQVEGTPSEEVAQITTAFQAYEKQDCSVATTGIAKAFEIVRWISADIQLLVHEGLSPILAAALENDVSQLIHHLGACSRIYNVPVPAAYIRLQNAGAGLFAVMMVLPLIHSWGYWVGVPATFSAGILLSAVKVAESFQTPFAKHGMYHGALFDIGGGLGIPLQKDLWATVRSSEAVAEDPSMHKAELLDGAPSLDGSTAPSLDADKKANTLYPGLIPSSGVQT